MLSPSANPIVSAVSSGSKTCVLNAKVSVEANIPRRPQNASTNFESSVVGLIRNGMAVPA
eukprot:4637902-Karenia_brevis.AAC.1